jgi:orotate phosphoribosyltransferase
MADWYLDPATRSFGSGLMASLEDKVRAAVSFHRHQRKGGGTTDYYVDGRQLVLDGHALLLCARVIALLASRLGATHVGGEPAAALPLAGAISAVAGTQGRTLDTFIVREWPKPGRPGQLIEGRFAGNARLLLVDDVIGRGSVASRCARLLSERGLTVVGFCALIDRAEDAVDSLQAAYGLQVWRLYDLSRLAPWIANELRRRME